MLVHQPCLDYLTLSEPCATGEVGALRELAREIGTRGAPGRRLGYDGFAYQFSLERGPAHAGTFYHGERVWQGQGWDLLIASGESAHWLIEHLWQTPVTRWYGVRCTRVDVQVTVPWPPGWFRIRDLDIVPDITATVIHGLNEETCWSETVYLGSRSSAVMVRAYRKRLDVSGQDWLRVEVEYKRDASKQLFPLLVAERHVGNWFLPVKERCPALYAMIEDSLDDDPDRPVENRVAGNTMHWLKTTVASCICRLLEDDDAHEETAELVRQLYAHTQACHSRRIDV